MLIRLIKYKLLLTMLFMAFQADAQEPVATAALDTNNMLIGDQVGLTLQFTGPAGVQVLWPSIPDTVLGKIDVLLRDRIDTTLSETGTTTTLTQRLLLTSFDTGFYVIPPIPFYFRELPDTTIRVAETRHHFLAVHTLAVDTTKPIKPIKGPHRAPITFREILPWILIGLAAAGIIAFIVYYLIKRRKKEPVFRFRQRVQLKPHEIALQEMEKLRIKKLWQQGKIKEYYSELTEIVRRYIEDRFLVPALESTSAEILHDLLELPEISREVWDQLGKLLMLADMVKFAKEKPLPEQNEESLERGIQFVNQTAINEELGMRNEELIINYELRNTKLT
ncbi:MAG: hypothetical protein D4R67_03910 [Bacteroidetes bacterium]|nr:MAG: hypothetical protein D4R67_03910 [Bacteroidota bacterium]